jgi:hypothetical protein
MKKVVLVVALGMIVAIAGAFADHPDGWGIGGGFQYGGPWRSGDYVEGSSGLTLFLKAPQLPVYWGISFWPFDLGDDPVGSIWLRVTGDYYLFDKTLVPDFNLGWFLGVGGYVYWYHASGEWTGGSSSANVFDIGARVPVGLSWQPTDFVEVFIDFGLSLGLQFTSWSSEFDIGGYKSSSSDTDFDIGGGWIGELGVRFWL